MCRCTAQAFVQSGRQRLLPNRRKRHAKTYLTTLERFRRAFARSQQALACEQVVDTRGIVGRTRVAKNCRQANIVGNIWLKGSRPSCGREGHGGIMKTRLEEVYRSAQPWRKRSSS
jgi:hypothetical protein